MTKKKTSERMHHRTFDQRCLYNMTFILSYGKNRPFVLLSRVEALFDVDMTVPHIMYLYPFPPTSGTTPAIESSMPLPFYHFPSQSLAFHMPDFSSNMPMHVSSDNFVHFLPSFSSLDSVLLRSHICPWQLVILALFLGACCIELERFDEVGRRQYLPRLQDLDGEAMVRYC